MSRAAKITLLIRTCLAILTLTVGILVFGPFGGDESAFGLTDKEAHALAFYALMALGALAMPRLRKWDIALICLALGGAIEVIQPFVGRDGNIEDWLADTTGVSLAMAPMLINGFVRMLNLDGQKTASRGYRRRRTDRSRSTNAYMKTSSHGAPGPAVISSGSEQ